jgi:hypothetical protein
MKIYGPSHANSNIAAGQELVEIIGLDEREYATYVELSLASLSVMIHCLKCRFSDHTES